MADDAVLDMAYRVRTSQLRFADVPEAQRKAVATQMARMSDAQMSEYAASRRFPRGGGHGEAHTSRVS